MIEIPTKEIISKINDQKGVSEEEVRAKIKEKLKQLAGLISEQGAAHIVANELGVQLVAEPSAAKIRDLYPGMRNVTIPGRVTRKFELREFDKDGRKGKVANFLIGDETGQVRVTLWNDQTDQFDKIADGDVVRVNNAWVKENRGYKELHLNTDSSLEVRPEGVEVSVGSPRVRKPIKDLAGDEENVEILGTVVQLYDPRYFEVGPDGKRATEGEETQTNYVVSAFLDDGTGTIRTTFWRQQSQRLLEKSDEEMLAYRDNLAAFGDVKTDMLGEIVKVVGRCKRNEQFDRIEFTANLVFRNVDPEQELARIKSESSESIETSDAPQPVKERMQETVMEKPVSRSEVTEELYEQELTEEAISLDDLEDLDEKL